MIARLYHEQAGMYEQLNQLSLAQVGYEKALAIREQLPADADPVALGETLLHLGPGLRGAEQAERRQAHAPARGEGPRGPLGPRNELVASARRDYEKVAGTP